MLNPWARSVLSYQGSWPETGNLSQLKEQELPGSATVIICPVKMTSVFKQVVSAPSPKEKSSWTLGRLWVDSLHQALLPLSLFNLCSPLALSFLPTVGLSPHQLCVSRQQSVNEIRWELDIAKS